MTTSALPRTADRATCRECGTTITYSAAREASGLSPWRDFRGLGGWAHEFGRQPYHAHRPA